MQGVSWAAWLILAIGGAGEPVADAAQWHPFAQREALMPKLEKSEIDPMMLRISAVGSAWTNGGWRRQFAVEGGRHYRFHGYFRAQDVASVRRSVVVQIDWKNQDGKRVGYPDYPEIGPEEGDWHALGGVYPAPSGAVSAVVDLILRWTPTGTVVWRDLAFDESAAPAARPVALVSVFHRPQSSSGPEQNRMEFSRFVERAGEAGADLVLLPEGMTMVGTGLNYLQVAETVPGPTTEFLGQLASRYRMYIVAGIVEQDGDAAYNTAVLVGRDGRYLGKYRKVSLPREEIEGGLTPGTDFPVFDLDFGRVGILICWDIQFPEGARRLAAQGAEIILLPIWGGTEELYPARAIENQIVLVSSSFDSPTAIWDHRGKLLAEAPASGGVAQARVDLAERTIWEWLGDLRSRIPRESAEAREVGID